ncbi:hypothetical protein [Phyllobacterium zundukense]|uniref:Uncharacterized protein n=1 Tax=Phyllobacterium zundukense TaxID=1867719 RepID=A0A2N9VS57_9HYPH|nr:hypothetical protein [Phyllobacterium zundukense]ATU92747.1 hypothetical protein BLM14_14750 [Phyllobacterium zundukense]PIO42325.1 hypothetical protein B5P45_25210 [Phyllobacterium zundukense]
MAKSFEDMLAEHTERTGDQMSILLAMIGQQRQAIHELIEIIEGMPGADQSKLSAIVNGLAVIPEGVKAPLASVKNASTRHRSVMNSAEPAVY